MFVVVMWELSGDLGGVVWLGGSLSLGVGEAESLVCTLVAFLKY